MRFGLFNLSPQLDPSRAAEQVLRDTVETVVIAESLGFDNAWVAEHHFSNLSLSPSPLLTLAHCAARTARIRLGAGVLVLPLYQPMRLVEEIAHVDVLSDGRLDLGVGSGSQVHESRGFEAQLHDSVARFTEVMDILEMAFARQHVSYAGKYFQIPPTPLSIRPIQRPHPPVYVAGMSADPAITRRIARNGYAAFASLFGPASGPAATKRAEYRQGFIDEGLDPDTLRFSGQRIVYVTDDSADARDARAQAIHTMQAVATVKGPAAKFDGHVIQVDAAAAGAPSDSAAAGLMIGSAEEVARLIAEDFKHLGLDQFSCFMQFGAIDRQRTVRSMERFMKDVVPLVRASVDAA